MAKAKILDIFELLAKMPESSRAAVNRAGYAEDLGMSLEQFDADFAGYLAEKQKVKIVLWREKFHTGSELDDGPVEVYVDGILPEGVTFIGSLPGVGKSWFGLSLARALTTGKPFMGVYHVKEIIPCLYLVPEMGDRAIRRRIEKLHMPMTEKFYCQTISDGICKLDDPVLKTAIAELKPVIFLDTAIRFSEAESENSSSDTSRSISHGVIRFRQWGARAVVCLHHSPKYSGQEEHMTLENVLRGSGDLGAVCDAVWGLRHDRRQQGRKLDVQYLLESMRSTRIFCICVKQRDFDPVAPFIITGRPFIDLQGDFAVLNHESKETVAEKILKAIKADPTRSIMSLKQEFGVGFDRVAAVAAYYEFKQIDGVWQTIPF